MHYDFGIKLAYVTYITTRQSAVALWTVGVGAHKSTAAHQKHSGLHVVISVHPLLSIRKRAVGKLDGVCSVWRVRFHALYHVFFAVARVVFGEFDKLGRSPNFRPKLACIFVYFFDIMVV